MPPGVSQQVLGSHMSGQFITEFQSHAAHRMCSTASPNATCAMIKRQLKRPAQGIQVLWVSEQQGLVERALIFVNVEHACLELRQPGAHSGHPVDCLATALESLVKQDAAGAKELATTKLRPAMYSVRADDGSACAAASALAQQPAGHGCMRVCSTVSRGAGMQAAVAALAGGAGMNVQLTNLMELQRAARQNEADEADWADVWCQSGAVEVFFRHLFTLSKPRSGEPCHM